MKPTTRYVIVFVFVVAGWFISSRLSSRRTSLDSSSRRDASIGARGGVSISPYRSCRGNTSSMSLLTSPSGLQMLLWTAPRQCGTKKKLPLLVYIHGAGEVGDDPAVLLDSEGGRGSIPSILCRSSTSTSGRDVPANDDDGADAEATRHPLLTGSEVDAVVAIPQSRFGWSASDDELRQVKAMLDDMIRDGIPVSASSGCTSSSPLTSSSTTSPIHIDSSRVIITGVSQGGYGTLRFATLFPTFASAVAPLCPFGTDGFSAAARSCTTMKVLLAHGKNDAVIPIEESRSIVQQCAECKPVTLTVDSRSSIRRALQSAQPPVDLKLCRFLFIEMERASDPLDENPSAGGHAVWRNVYATSSPFWAFVFSP